MGTEIEYTYRSQSRTPVDDLKTNGSGYQDPTAYNAIKNTLAEEDRFHKLLSTIQYICDVADFEISERIVLTDKKTGRVWR